MANKTYTLTIKKPEGPPDTYPVPAGATTLGRQAGVEVMLPHTQVSRRHARLDAGPEACRISDLGSSNGTFLNGTKLAPNAPADLKDGDLIKIGPFEIRVSAKEVEAAEPAEARPDPSIVETVEPAPEPEKKKPAKKAPAKRAKADEPEAPGDPGPPPPPTGTVVEPVAVPPEGDGIVPPGLDIRSRKLLAYLPGIYQTDFMARFLGIFEATMVPLEWTIDNFDLFLSPDTSPQGFLPWLASWFGVTFDASWSEAKRRALLKEAHAIYARRGTSWALSRVLEIYTGEEPEIDDTSDGLEDFTFEVSLAQRKRDVDEDLVAALIEVHKPAHTSYKLKFKR